MGIIRSEEICGYRFGDEIICKDCIAAKEEIGIKEDIIITLGELSKTDDYYFCDRCKEQMN